MHIPMTDLTAQYASMKKEIDEAILRVIESGRFILGQEVEAFEKEIAAYCGVKHAIGVASGTDALILSLMAAGVKRGDEVITTPFTFFATTEAIIHCGAIPVFVDIDHKTFNIDTRLIESKITPRTRAIIPVHLFGQPAEMDAILRLSKKYNLKIIEDCAQALSAKYNDKSVGSIGDAGCFSFFPSKNLGAYGDGGMVVTSDSQIADTIRMLRQHGSKTTYYYALPGFNSRLDAVQAAILRVKLKHLDSWSHLRRQVASLYTQLLNNVRGIETPYVGKNITISANYYTIRLINTYVNRDELHNYLISKDIDTAIYYPLSLHLQKAHEALGYRLGDFPQSESAQDEVLSLPMYPEITQNQVVKIADSIKEYLNH